MRYDQISSSDRIPPGITFNRFGLMWSDLRSNRDNLTSFNILCVYWRFKYTNAPMKFKWMHRKYKKWTKQQTHLLLLSNSPAPFSYVKDNGQLGTENASIHPSIWRDSPMKVIVLQVPSTKLKSSSQRAASPTKLGCYFLVSPTFIKCKVIGSWDFIPQHLKYPFFHYAIWFQSIKSRMLDMFGASRLRRWWQPLRNKCSFWKKGKTKINYADNGREVMSGYRWTTANSFYTHRACSEDARFLINIQMCQKDMVWSVIHRRRQGCMDVD